MRKPFGGRWSAVGGRIYKGDQDMKQIKSKTKRARNTAGAWRQEASAGPKGLAISPPDHGIDIVVREPVDAPPEHNKERQPLASGASIQRKAEALGVDKDLRQTD